MINLTEVIAACVLVLTVVIALVSLILTMDHVRKNQYLRRKEDRERKYNAEIDDYRRYYEEKIYSLQRELSSNERRWADANHLIVSGQNTEVISIENSPSSIQSPSVFFKSLGINADEIAVKKKTIFVLTPFSSEGTETYYIIKKVCGDVDLKCSRGDETHHNDNILSHIIRSILQANIVIVNIDGRNPNVFYELGICHTIGKPVIIISHLNLQENLPFDINAKNIIFYKDVKDLQSQLKTELLKVFISSTKSE